MVGEAMQLSRSFLVFVWFPVRKVEPKTWCVLGKTFYRVPAIALVFTLLFTHMCKCVTAGIKPKVSYMPCKHFLPGHCLYSCPSFFFFFFLESGSTLPSLEFIIFLLQPL